MSLRKNDKCSARKTGFFFEEKFINQQLFRMRDHFFTDYPKCRRENTNFTFQKDLNFNFKVRQLITQHANFAKIKILY